MVIIGNVETFPNVKADKAQVLKVLEESSEVFSAWENYDNGFEGGNSASDKWILDDLLDECADVMQALCNLIAGLGVEDFTRYIEFCRQRNDARGRYGQL